MVLVTSIRCPFCGSRVTANAYACPRCGAEVAMYWEDLRIGRLFLLMLVGSVLSGIIAFSGAMFYVGIDDTFRLVMAAWGFSILILLALGWLAGRLRDGAR